MKWMTISRMFFITAKFSTELSNEWNLWLLLHTDPPLVFFYQEISRFEKIVKNIHLMHAHIQALFLKDIMKTLYYLFIKS